MSQAGLFSAVASAFIIEVSSQLQPDPSEETAALLRVLIYKVDNTTFGDIIPTIPQPWTDPPRMIVEVQAILFASLAVSLFSAFLAMLGKQWLTRYASVDIRGSAIERSQNRQRKFDGIVNWHFDRVMGSLPLMLQVALLLLGCALSRYLLEIDKTVASVVLGATSFGVLFYLSIVIAGAASVSCPYHTPGADVLRYIPDTLLRIQDALFHIGETFDRLPYIFHPTLDIFRHIPATFHRAPDIFHHIPATIRHITNIFHRIPHNLDVFHSLLVEYSLTYQIPYLIRHLFKLGRPKPSYWNFVLLRILLLPIWLILDVCGITVWLLVICSRWLRQELEPQATVLDLHCISWTLRTSMDGPVRLSALDYLQTVISAGIEPTLVVGCFDVLFSCVKSIDKKAAITQAQGSKQLVTASALYCLQALPHLIDTGSRVYEGARQRYTQAFPPQTRFDHLTVPYTLAIIHSVFYSGPHSLMSHRLEVGKKMEWEAYKPSNNNEHTIVAHALTVVSRRFKSPKPGRVKVPRWILRFALHSLSQSPPPSTSVVVSCLTIIAIDLGHDPLNKPTLDERCVCT